MSLAGLAPGSKQVKLTAQWREHSLTGVAKANVRRATAALRLHGAGTAWLDLFQITPVAKPK